MWPFKPDWMSKNEGKALKAVEKETDQTKLAEIAKAALVFSVREAAVEKLTKQSLLAVIAKNEADGYVRKTALEKLTDAALLKGIEKFIDVNTPEEALNQLLTIFPRYELDSVDHKAFANKHEDSEQVFFNSLCRKRPGKQHRHSCPPQGQRHWAGVPPTCKPQRGVTIMLRKSH